MRTGCLLAVLAAVLGVASVSRADSVQAEFLNVTNGGIVLSVTQPQLGTVAGYVGQYNWVTQSNSSLGATGTSFYTFCIELNQDINFSHSYTYDLIDPSGAPRPGEPAPGGGMGAAKALLISELWGQHIGDVLSAPDASTEIMKAAEFQVAVWKIVYGNVTTNNSSIDGVADGWISTLNPNGAKADIIALSSDGPNGAQDQITAVPLPSTVWMGSALLTALGILKLRHNAARPVSQLA